MPDKLTREQRRRCMQANKSKNTSIEIMLRKGLFARGLRYKLHVRDLPGRPDVVFSRKKVAVFIDGDFWHGYRYPQWKNTLSIYWDNKIQTNRRRDNKNFRRLRRMGWRVIRLWEHEIRSNVENCVERVVDALNNDS